MLRYLKPFFDEINLPKLNTCILTAEASPLDLVKSGMVVYQMHKFSIFMVQLKQLFIAHLL